MGSCDRQHRLVHDPVHGTTLQVCVQRLSYSTVLCRPVPGKGTYMYEAGTHVATPSIFGTVPHSEKNNSEGEECHIMLNRIKT